MTIKRIGTVRTISKFEERFWIALVVVIALAFVVGFATVALGWTLEDCVEVDFDHPDCDQYTTTTTEVPPSSTSSTQPESTTSTSGPGNFTTTSTPVDTSTSTTVTSDTSTPTTDVPVTTTSIPFDSIPSTTDTTSVISTTVTALTELPFTGTSDLGLLALAGVSLLFLGFTALKYGRSEE